MSTESKAAIVPVVEEQDPRSAARIALEAVAARDEAVADVKKIMRDGSVWAYSCDRKRGHFGIFFVNDPRQQQVFGPGDWYSVYHDNRQAFDFELADVVCQQCFIETGERVPLRVAPAPSPSRKDGVCFRIATSWMERFTHEVKREVLDQWLTLKKTPTPTPEKTDARSHAARSS